jgi:succinate-semialdehyde dehydrogenase/glutarate-semialdehyde dehydrogenase
MINEVMFSAGLPETPWGGIKDSGIGRKHSEQGLFEFVNTLHINQPRLGLLSFKSWWWFPYTPYQRQFFESWIRLYKKGFVQKALELPHFLWCLAKFLKNEPRI